MGIGLERLSALLIVAGVGLVVVGIVLAIAVVLGHQR
jgi:hypothetical protein